MKSFLAAIFLSANLLSAYEITNTHVLAVATSALWVLGSRVKNEHTCFEYELSGMTTGFITASLFLTKKSQIVEPTWKPSPVGVASATIAGLLFSLRNKSPLPYTIAALAVLRDFYKKEPVTMVEPQSHSLKRDLHYWIGMGLATGALTISQSVADAFCITDQAARGSMLALSAIFLADALQKQYGI